MKLPVNDCIDISLEMTLDSGLSASAAVSAFVGFRSAFGSVGAWPAEVNNNAVEYKAPANAFSEVGIWTIWPRVIFSETQAYTGTATKIEVVNPWDNID